MTDMALSGGAPQHFARDAAGLVPASASRMGAEILEGADAYSYLRADWLALAARQPGVVCFQAQAMLAVWARHFGGAASALQTLVVRDQGRVVLIWPLQVSRKGPLRIIGAAGAPIAQYDDLFLDPECDRAAALSAAMEAVKDKLRPDVMAFSHVRPEAWLNHVLGPEALQIGSAEGAPFTDLSSGMDAVRAGLKTRVRQQQRKRMQKIESSGALEFRISEDPVEAAAWLDEILAIKRRWLVSTGRVSRAFADPRTADCLRGLAKALATPSSSPRMVISKLSLDGAMAAMEVGFAHRGAYHLYIGAFSEELARLGPGNVITEKVMEWCADQAIQRYDMMPPRTRNKGEWQTGEVEVADYVLPLTRAGSIYAAVMMQRVSPALRDGFYRLPDRWRSAIAARTLRI